MTTIYFDESGDLGMDCKECAYFIISAVKINHDTTNALFGRIPKKIRQRGLKKKAKETAELKFSNSSPLIREMYLKRAAELDIEIYSLIIEKKYTYDRLKDDLSILYNYLIRALLEKVLPSVATNEKLVIVLDRFMSPSQRSNFENYIKTEFFSLFQKLPDIEINHEDSQNRNELQVVDFVCGAFGYKYNTTNLKGDCHHYVDIIGKRIVVEKTDFFKPRERKTNPAYWS
jgi:hypothetical protein